MELPCAPTRLICVDTPATSSMYQVSPSASTVDCQELSAYKCESQPAVIAQPGFSLLTGVNPTTRQNAWPMFGRSELKRQHHCLGSKVSSLYDYDHGDSSAPTEIARPNRGLRIHVNTAITHDSQSMAAGMMKENAHGWWSPLHAFPERAVILTYVSQFASKTIQLWARYNPINA